MSFFFRLLRIKSIWGHQIRYQWKYNGKMNTNGVFVKFSVGESLQLIIWPFQKIKAAYVKDPERYVTLQDIVEAEREAHSGQWPKVGATLALMWLKRWERSFNVVSLNFNLLALRRARLSVCVSAGSPLQRSPFHPDPPAESGRWRKGWKQPQPHSGECDQSVRRGAEELPRLVGPKDL